MFTIIHRLHIIVASDEAVAAVRKLMQFILFQLYVETFLFSTTSSVCFTIEYYNACNFYSPLNQGNFRAKDDSNFVIS